MLRIINRRNGRQTDYSKLDLAREAKWNAKHAKDSDGKARAWYISVTEGPSGAEVSLVVDYLTLTGDARSLYVAI